MKKLSIYLTSDTTTDYLAKFISENNTTIECKIAPYNQVIQVLLSEPKSNVLLIWSCQDKQISQYKKLIEFEKFDINEIYK